jgi:WhiB family redox-sensing transcriptional regulator
MISRSMLTFSPGAAGRVLAALELDTPTHWGQQARCGEVDPALFFDETDEGVALAKWACTRCPVRTECRDWAITEGVEFGVFGGSTPAERGVPARPKGDVVDQFLRIGGKRCTGCEAIKPLAEFHVASDKRSGHRSECKVCVLEHRVAGVAA